MPGAAERGSDLTVKVTVNIDLAKASQISGEANLRGVRAATIEAKNLVIAELSQRGTGTPYKRGSKIHVASEPGRPPAPDTGRLRGSTQTEVFQTPGGALGIVSVNTEYAAALELGTEKMAARPFISTVAREGAERLRAVFAKFARVP